MSGTTTPRIVEVLSEIEDGPYLIRAEMVIFDSPAQEEEVGPFLQFARYKGHVSDWSSQEIRMEYRGRPAFSEKTMRWIQRENLIEAGLVYLAAHA